MDKKHHWEQVYSTKAPDSVGWFQEHAELSLLMIKNTGLGKEAAIIDVGGGASTLVDDLVAEGYTDLSILDLSSVAISVVKQRLGSHADAVEWMVGDITRAELPVHRFDIWHDRAVFHFLTDPSDRQAYVERVTRAVRPGGHVIIATFCEDGPEKCSGLPVIRYRPESMHAELGDAFLLVDHKREVHQTPFGTSQQFVYCHCRKGSS
ncbi:MAG: class I SAM-dependent methyltransferase [Sulfuricellaceae bacterium]|nr:class I SAM-dependent methyltransferase [Sulfuricellaceae bacterium]